jgi:2-oxoglutarate ferredoxin oxidoreductase subunit alpha
MQLANPPTRAVPREELDSVVIRFAGDSGDGMQITGTQFTTATALMGNDLATFPDFPAEIRAPAGTTYGVSGFQIHFASRDIRTPGDAPDVLVAMNPAALKVNLDTLKVGGLLIVNTGAFTSTNLDKAGYTENPLEDPSLERFRVLAIDITKLTLDAVKEFKLGAKDAGRCKNMWTLGLMFWLFGREKDQTVEFLRQKFGKKDPAVADANIAALNAGHVYGESAEMPSNIGVYQVPKADLAPGLYRNIDGNQAVAWGIAAAAKLSGLPIMYGSYPITPASALLHHLAKLKNFGVTTFQAEDEIAAVAAAVGASFGGALGVTGTSGPGVALKGEAIGLAIATELPLVIVDVQRGGPSTGLPTKTEQSDLFIAVWGRNGDAPIPVLAAATPGECFHMAIEAVRLATKYMTPVMLLTDGYIANGAEPWKIPSFDDLEPFPVKFHEETEGFFPFKRDPETLGRVWAVPGTPGLEHRIGGLEKNRNSGHISYDAENHHQMTKIRAQKIQNVQKDIPPARVEQGEATGDIVVVGWGSTFGAISQAVAQLRDDGKRVSHVHIRNLWPLPAGLGDLLRGFRHIMVPELNNGQLEKLLRAELLVDAQGYDRIGGQPFRIAELVAEIEARLATLTETSSSRKAGN